MFDRKFKTLRENVRIMEPGLLQKCHGASCMQANNAEGRKNDRLRKERKGRESS